MPICPACLDAATTLLLTEAEQAHIGYEKAKGRPDMRPHVKQLQRRWVALGWAAGHLRRAAREGRL